MKDTLFVDSFIVLSNMMLIFKSIELENTQVSLHFGAICIRSLENLYIAHCLRERCSGVSNIIYNR